MDDQTGARRTTSSDPSGELPFDVVDYLPHLIAAIDQFRDSSLDAALRPHGLNVGRYRVLGVLSRFGLCTMTELANFTAIDRTTLTRIADHLVAAAWVERRSDPKDRRQVKLELTAAGTKVHRKALSVVLQSNSRLMAGVADKDARAAARVLQSVVRNLAPTESARDSIIRYARKDAEKRG